MDRSLNVNNETIKLYSLVSLRPQDFGGFGVGGVRKGTKNINHKGND